MLKLYENIKNKRIELGLSQAEIAKKVGYTDRSMIAKIENGQVDLTQSKIYEFAKALQCTPAYLMGWDDEPTAAENNTSANIPELENVRPVKVKTIPLFSEIACGEPILASEDIKCYVPIDEDIDADFCVIAKGDSMTGARINDGDIVFIQSATNINNGDIAAVWIDGDGATLKRVYTQDNTLSLIAENPKYPPMVFTEERTQEIRLLGKAIAFQSNI